jgi:hypothetical protein
VSVNISSNNAPVANSTSATVTVNPVTTGNPTGTFTVQTFKGGSALFTASLGSQTASGNLEVVGLKGLSPSTATLQLGGSSNQTTATVTLTDTAPIDAVISLSSVQIDPTTGKPIGTPGSQTLLTVPPSVTVAAGQSSKSFTMTAPNQFENGTVQVTASLAGDSQSETITIFGAPR